MGKYEAKGTGLNDPATRKKIYTGIIVALAVIVAGCITAGVFSREQVTEFIGTFGWAVGILAGVLGIVTAALARNNVEDPDE